MRLLAGLDVGTSAIKGILAAEDGRILARGKRSVPFLKPKPDFVEIDPEEHYRSVTGLIAELAAAAPPGDRVAAVSMAFASGNTLLTDARGAPLTNIIGWLDRRTVGAMDDLLPEVPRSEVHRIVGWHGIETFPLAHLAWFRRHAPEAWRKKGRVAMNNDWLGFRLTGRWAMDHSTATTFYLQDQVARKWHAPYLRALGIGEEALPLLAPSGSVVGTLSPAAARDAGLTADTLLVLGAFDHPCAARGTGILSPGELLLSCGTSWVGFYPSNDRDLLLSQGLIVDPFLSPEGPWAGMFALTAVGVTVEWFIDNVVLPASPEGSDRYAAFNGAAAAAARGAGGLFLNPFKPSAAFAPRLDALRKRGKDAVARAVMEGTAFEMRKKLEALSAAGLGARRIAMVGGPSESPVWPRILAEITGLELTLVNGQTAGAVGAAILAGMGAGVFRDLAEGSGRFSGGGTVIRPEPAAARAYDGLWDGYRDAVSRGTAF